MTEEFNVKSSIVVNVNRRSEAVGNVDATDLTKKTLTQRSLPQYPEYLGEYPQLEEV